MASFLNVMMADRVAALLDVVDETQIHRFEFSPAMKREVAFAAIQSILWVYGARAGSTAAAFAIMGLWDALGLEPTAEGLRSKGPADGTQDASTTERSIDPGIDP